jgi:hypothetical protein
MQPSITPSTEVQMKRVLAGLSLGAMLCLAPIAQAATTLEFPAFTITYIDGPAPENWNISVAAQTPLTTSISLDTLNQDVQNFPANDLTGAGAMNGGGHQSALQVDVRAGYHVTGVSLHALAYGELGVGQVPDGEPGSAANFASIGFLLTAPGAALPFSWQLEDFNGLQPVALGSGTLSLDGTFRLDIGASVFAQAWGAVGPDSSSESHALASFGNALLNIQVSPVPEPSAYAMLLGGLALLGMAARARRN